MTQHPFDNLTPAMRERLERWRKNVLPVKSAEVLRGSSPGNYVARRRDHGDDLQEFENLRNQKKQGK